MDSPALVPAPWARVAVRQLSPALAGFPASWAGSLCRGDLQAAGRGVRAPQAAVAVGVAPEPARPGSSHHPDGVLVESRVLCPLSLETSPPASRMWVSTSVGPGRSSLHIWGTCWSPRPWATLSASAQRRVSKSRLPLSSGRFGVKEQRHQGLTVRAGPGLQGTGPRAQGRARPGDPHGACRRAPVTGPSVPSGSSASHPHTIALTWPPALPQTQATVPQQGTVRV